MRATFVGGPMDGRVRDVSEISGAFEVPVRDGLTHPNVSRCYYDLVRFRDGDARLIHICGSTCPWDTAERMKLRARIEASERDLLDVAKHPYPDKHGWVDEVAGKAYLRFRALDHYELVFGRLPEGVER